jgi:AcrR family transcriptional regulator
MPERGLGGRPKRRPERHDQILLAAVTLFEQNGYHGTSVDQIAAEIGITATSVYRHFVNKQAILDTAMVWISDQILSRLSPAAPNPEVEARPLGELVDGLIETVLSVPLFVSLLTQEFSSLSPDTRIYCVKRREEYLAYWYDALTVAAPAMGQDEARLRVHLVVSMIASVTAVRTPQTLELAPLLRTMSLDLLQGDAPSVPARRGRRRR